MQYLRLVGCGPSSKTCPKCEPHFLQFTSVLSIPWLVSFRNSMLSLFKAREKLGQPVPESNFVSDEKSSRPQHVHL